jgi:hypothetical protein
MLSFSETAFSSPKIDDEHCVDASKMVSIED